MSKTETKLTVEWLRSYPQFTDTDEETLKMYLHSMKLFCTWVYEIMSNKKTEKDATDSS